MRSGAETPAISTTASPIFTLVEAMMSPKVEVAGTRKPAVPDAAMTDAASPTGADWTV